MKKQYLLIISFVFLIVSLGCGILGGATNNPPTAQVRIITPTRTPMPTFTPTAPLSAEVVIPTATNTPVPPPSQEQQPTEPTATPLPPTNTPVPAPQASITGATVNVRSGPGTAYPRVGQVSNGYTSAILGRNNDASWVFINYPGGQGWIYSNLAQLQGDIDSVPVPQIAPPPATPTPPPPPPPTATPVPAGPTYPYKIYNIFTKPNGAITQIRGYIQDAAGNPVDGLRVRVRIGSFCTVSVPSGTPGVYPRGNYDVLLDARAKDGDWLVAIVDRPTDPKITKCDPGANQLSEEVSVHTSTTDGVVFVEFQKIN